MTKALFASLVLLAASIVSAADLPGAAVYQSRCASCHAKDGGSDTMAGKTLKATDLRTAELQKKTDAQLSAAVTAGKGKMQPIKSLQPDQVRDVVAYVRTLAKH